MAVNRLIVFLFFIMPLSLAAQTEITGKVSELSGEPIPGASIILKNNEGKIAAYTASGENGAYKLEAKGSGDCVLEVHFLGYEKQSVAIKVGEAGIIQDFVLKESEEQLKEIIIEQTLPVKLRGDTLVYDAKALSLGNEVVVEDLLKNIPGITIAEDGTIRFGDQQIEKVMVDGDDLFNRGYSLLTKNMPSKPLNKVEVLQNYSNNKLLKGVENSAKVALNLTLDEEYKSIWFGNLAAGYGSENRYNVNGNLMNFGKSYKNYFSFDLNNAGFNRVGNISDMFYNSNDMESIGRSGRAVQVMNMGLKTPRLDERHTRFNNAGMVTLSSILPLGAKAKLKLRGFLGFDELRSFNNSYSVIDLEGTYFENSEINLSTNKLRKGYVNAFLTYDISATQMFESSGTFNTGSTDFSNDYTFNGTSTREALETRNTYFDQKLTYTYKWNKRNVVLLKGRFLTDKLPQEYGINDYLLGNLFMYNGMNAIGNNVASSKQYAGLQADFKLKQKNGDLIEFNVGYDDSNDDLATQFRLFTDQGTLFPDDFQSDSSYKVGDLYTQSGYRLKLGAFSVGTLLNAHQLFNRFTNAQGETRRQDPFFINPLVNAGWEINPDNTLSASYGYNVTNSTLLEVNDAYLLRSSRSFNKGVGDFNQWESSNANINFTTKHYLNRYSFSMRAEYSKQNDVISYRSRINQNSSLSEAFIIQGGDRISGSITSHRVVKKLNGTVRLEARASRFVYYNMINDSGLRKNTAYGQSYTLGWASSFKSAFNFNFQTEWNFSKVVSDNTFKNSDKYSFVDLMYRVKDNFNIKARAEQYYFGGQDSNNNYFFADLEAKYSFLKDKYSISLDGRNLFNTDNFTTYSVSDFGYSTNSYRLLPRYVMVSFMYRF